MDPKDGRKNKVSKKYNERGLLATRTKVRHAVLLHLPHKINLTRENSDAREGGGQGKDERGSWSALSSMHGLHSIFLLHLHDCTK